MEKKALSSELIGAAKTSDFLRWQLPSFDEQAVNVIEKEKSELVVETAVEEVVLEDVHPLTLEAVEAVRQDAYNEGLSAGEKDGFHAGQLKAQKESEAALAPRLQALENIMAQLCEPIARQDQALENIMLELVKRISEQVIQRELSLSSAQIANVVQEALKLLPLDGGQVRIFLHPQDFAQIKALRERHEEKWRILEDTDLLPGGCRVETSHSRIDATIETRLKTITQQLLEQQHALHTEPLAADDIQEFTMQVPETSAAATETTQEIKPDTDSEAEQQTQ